MYMYMYIHAHVQCICMEAVWWNSSNLDTTGTEESVLVREVSIFQGLKCTQAQNLGRENVSCLERCPKFRGVFLEYTCTCVYMYMYSCTVYLYYTFVYVFVLS